MYAGMLTVSCVMSMSIHFIAGLCRKFFVIISFMQILLKSILVMFLQPESYLNIVNINGQFVSCLLQTRAYATSDAFQTRFLHMR